MWDLVHQLNVMHVTAPYSIMHEMEQKWSNILFTLLFLARTHTRDKALSTHHDNKEATADSRGGVKSLIESPNIIFHYSSSLPSPEGSSLRKFNDSIYYFEVMF